MEKEIQPFIPFCKEKIKDELQNYAGNEYYASDLGSYLTEDINANGTFTYSGELAKDYIKEWWNEAASYWEYEKDNFGDNQHNPFEEPEAFTVCMVIEGVNALLSRCKVIDDKWNDKIKLTKATINKIIKQLDEIDDYEDLF